MSLATFDSVNNALRINANLTPGGTHTPADADQVFTSIFDSVNNAVRVNCVVGCSSGATFGTDITSIDSTHQKVVGLQTIPIATTAPTSGQCLSYNGAQWAPGACGTGGGAPGGANTAVQFNSSSSFGGDAANFFYNTSTHALTVAGAITASSFLGSGTTAGCVQLNEAQANGASYDQLCAPSSLGANVTWTLPAADGASSQVLETNGSGALGWTNVNPFISVSNAATTGTTLNTLTKLTGAPTTAVIAATTDTGGAVGITTAGAGNSGTAVITTAGQVSCLFDGATTAGDYVQISSTTAGDCHDSGSSYPTSGQVIGRGLSTNAAAGAYPIDLFNAELRASSGGVFQVNGTNTTSQSTINFQNGSNITVSNPSAGNVAFNLSGAVPVTNGGTGQATAGANTVFGNCTTVAGAPGFCTLTGPMLPSPSPTALGGVQSFAPVSHQWVNSISTSGVPAASQPAFSDISGPLAFSQETVRNFLQVGSGGAASVSEGTAGITRAWAFIVSVPITISHLVFNVGTADATAGTTSCPNLAGASQTNVQCYDVGIFSSSGALLGDIGPHQFNATGINDFAIASQTLLPGKYYFALTGTGTAAAVTATNSAIISPLVNVNVNQATVGGQLVSFTPPADVYAIGGPILTLHN
ncbi:MAG TPA: hypothetical protein VGW33_15290 [Terriglobia bacterium]|nr:hypothetical protein [Terriglobia bacterium]